MVVSPEELRKRRLELGLSQKKLSEDIGISQSILSKFEAKKHFPGYHALRKLEEGLISLEKRRSYKISRIMTATVCSFPSKARAGDVARIFKTKGYSQAPVIDDGHVVGLISARGLLDAEKSEPISQFLEPEPPIISQETPVTAAKLLLKQFTILLVSNKGKIVGIVTREDVI